MFHALQNYFNKIPTRPFLGDLLITGLSKWLRNEPAIFFDFPPIYSSLIFHQTRIGWKQLFVGRFVYEWSNLQQDYLVLQRIVQEIFRNIMDYRSHPAYLETCLPKLGCQKCRFTWGRCGHARISQVCPSTKGNRRNLLATLSCPASRSGCILQQYQ